LPTTTSKGRPTGAEPSDSVSYVSERGKLSKRERERERDRDRDRDRERDGEHRSRSAGVVGEKGVDAETKSASPSAGVSGAQPVAAAEKRRSPSNTLADSGTQEEKSVTSKSAREMNPSRRSGSGSGAARDADQQPKEGTTCTIYPTNIKVLL
jgi:hypothetical protein